MLKRTLFLFSIATLFFCCENKINSKEVVFVCPHGAARSPIAAAYFNKMAKEKNLSYHATFRGTEPDETLSARTIEGLIADGIDIEGWKPTLITAKDINKAYQIVTFDCDVPAEKSTAIVAQWNGTPSPSKEFENYRAIVQGKVKQLIENLPKN